MMAPSWPNRRPKSSTNVLTACRPIRTDPARTPHGRLAGPVRRCTERRAADSCESGSGLEAERTTPLGAARRGPGSANPPGTPPGSSAAASSSRSGGDSAAEPGVAGGPQPEPERLGSVEVGLRQDDDEPAGSLLGDAVARAGPLPEQPADHRTQPGDGRRGRVGSRPVPAGEGDAQPARRPVARREPGAGRLAGAPGRRRRLRGPPRRRGGCGDRGPPGAGAAARRPSPVGPAGT